MIKNQNILATLMPFSNLQKISMKNFYKKTTSKTATAELLSKIPDRKKISDK